MNFQNTILYHPQRVLWIGSILLGGMFLFPSVVHFMNWGEKTAKLEAKEIHLGEKKINPVTFDLGLESKSSPFLIPNLEGEMTFSFDPPRPDGTLPRPQLWIRLKKAAQSKRVILPCRIDLQYGEGDKIFFSEGESLFWIDLSLTTGGQIEALVNISSDGSKVLQTGRFFASPQESPLRTAQEFSEGSPFRLLAEARWWGRDLFREKIGAGTFCERLEIGPSGTADLMEISEKDWIAWQDGHWYKTSSLNDAKIKPVAHIQSIGKTFVLEGWDQDHHIRISLNPAVAAPFKVKAEELFSSVRVRSEKQISCMLEKQCLILKIGDWVLKKGGRWKVLRKKEERDDFLNGELVGDLFVFEKIELKQGQKYIQGHFFNSGRSQMASIETAAHLMRKTVSASGENRVKKTR